jgi:hypothetical protein
MRAEYITKKDEAEMANFIGHHFPHLAQQPDVPLHHYTTGENLISIISKGELWATHVSCVNDTKEMHYAVEELHKRVMARIPQNENPDLNPLLEALVNLLADPRIEIAPYFITAFLNSKMT